METLIIDHNNGHKTEYVLIPDGDNLPIAYHKETPKKVIDALEHARKYNIRIRMDLGDTKTGVSWNEKYDVAGRIGLSRGDKARFPILLNNKRSIGGTHLLDNCIIGIKDTKTKRVLYAFSPSSLPELI